MNRYSEPARLIYSASAQGRYVMFAHLEACAETDSELVSALKAAHDLGVEVRGDLPYWVEKRLLEAISR